MERWLKEIEVGQQKVAAPVGEVAYCREGARRCLIFRVPRRIYKDFSSEALVILGIDIGREAAKLGYPSVNVINWREDYVYYKFYFKL